MTSLIVIGGEIIELLDDSNDIQLALGKVSASEHRKARAENKESVAALKSFSTSRGSATPGRDSFAEHWLKTGTHNIRAFGEESGKRKIGLIKNPILFGIWGIGQSLEVVGMHYDYFVKGESQPW